MKTHAGTRFRRVLTALSMGLALGLGSGAAAFAAPSVPEPFPAPGTPDGKSATSVRSLAAGCPGPGQRVKMSTSDKIYLIDASQDLLWVSSVAYSNLWDNWSGIGTYDNLVACGYATYHELSNAWLAKSFYSPHVYIYDSTYQEYRWIAGGDVFAKYGFSWSKLRSQPSISPIGENWY